MTEVQHVRQNFAARGYKEGQVYKTVPLEKKSIKDRLLMQSSKKIPVLTIRDYLCHLNFTRNDIKDVCKSCGKVESRVLYFTLQRLPQILCIGFTELQTTDQVISVNEAERLDHQGFEFMTEKEVDLSLFVKDVNESHLENEYIRTRKRSCPRTKRARHAELLFLSEELRQNLA